VAGQGAADEQAMAEQLRGDQGVAEAAGDRQRGPADRDECERPQGDDRVVRE